MLHIDIETYSSVDLRSAGLYKYTQSLDFEILLVAYAFGKDRPTVIDLANGQALPRDFVQALLDPTVPKAAHNAAFERLAFSAVGYPTQARAWHCSAVLAAVAGLPLSLAKASEALALKGKEKDASGKALIRYFSMPCKPTKSNEGRQRNMPWHDPDKWEAFKAYCAQDVVAEQAIHYALVGKSPLEDERKAYLIDQEINDRGVLVDLTFAKAAVAIDTKHSKSLNKQMRAITGLDNPNSVSQLKNWLEQRTGLKIKSLAKEALEALMLELDDEVAVRALYLRSRMARSSVKKYTAMLACASDEDQRARGLFQFYGANRTGRWAGRLVQLQNLPRSYMPAKELDQARELVKQRDYDALVMLYDNLPDVLSQLIRTAFIAEPGKTLIVSDFSAIEARVIAWLAKEKWRLDVFASHGKIYEASASRMFGVPIDQITKGSELRTRGKIAELALGYQGGVGALTAMGADKMGMSEADMRVTVNKWRKANPNIVAFWTGVGQAALDALSLKRPIAYMGLMFEADQHGLGIVLPSGRTLNYYKARIALNRYGFEGIVYKGQASTGPGWVDVDTYGGKLVENIVQATARDLLRDAMQRLTDNGFEIIMHVHDEVVCQVDQSHAEQKLEELNSLMTAVEPWAQGLPLAAEGFITNYYTKD